MPPAQENSYDPGYFSNGNPATGELATMMTAEWCNGVQEELLAVIQDAKLTPSGTDLKQLLQALKYFFSTSEAEKWRKAMIGSLVPMAVSSLPGGFGMPDGSLFLFEDYPELKEKYDAGGFNGMLLEANASAEDKAAWAGKWVKHSEGIGLYAPRLSGLFLRGAGLWVDIMPQVCLTPRDIAMAQRTIVNRLPLRVFFTTPISSPIILLMLHMTICKTSYRSPA